MDVTCRRRSMFARSCTFALLVAAAIASVIGCEDSSAPQLTTHPVSILDQTPRTNSEAEAAALWLSGDLVAPQDTYEALRDAFGLVRGEFSDSIPALEQIVFVAPWVPGEVLVKLLPDAVSQVRRGEHTDLDSLNTFYRATSTDTTLLRIRWMRIDFEGRLHPERLAEAYAAVPSLENAEPNGQWFNERDNYPWLLDDGVSLLFREGWGDCPSGCIFNQFWYFRVKDDNVEYVGTFVRGQDPFPDWWDEAKTAYETKQGG